MFQALLSLHFPAVEAVVVVPNVQVEDQAEDVDAPLVQ